MILMCSYYGKLLMNDRVLVIGSLLFKISSCKFLNFGYNLFFFKENISGDRNGRKLL